MFTAGIGTTLSTYYLTTIVSWSFESYKEREAGNSLNFSELSKNLQEAYIKKRTQSVQQLEIYERPKRNLFTKKLQKNIHYNRIKSSSFSNNR